MHRLMRLTVATALAATPMLAMAGGAAAQTPPPPFPPFPPPAHLTTFPTPIPFPPFPAPTPIPLTNQPGPVTATLAGDTLTVSGRSGDDLVAIFPSDIVSDGISTVRGGATSVDLDLPLLEQAAGLTLTGADTPGRPTGSGFLVGFPILPSTDFRYVASPFAPVSGTIRHTGTVTFNGDVTVGDFDPARATDGRSGFFVASTTGVEAILFDVAPPSSVAAAVNRLNIGRTDLLVSPEFAAFLANPDLTGAVVGAARIDSLAAISAGRQLTVTTANGLLAPIDSTWTASCGSRAATVTTTSASTRPPPAPSPSKHAAVATSSPSAPSSPSPPPSTSEPATTTAASKTRCSPGTGPSVAAPAPTSGAPSAPTSLPTPSPASSCWRFAELRSLTTVAAQ